MKEKDWRLKVRLEEELQIHPSYGSRRNLLRQWDSAASGCRGSCVCLASSPTAGEAENGEHPKVSRAYLNLLLAVMPAYANHIWAADFTEFVQHGKKVYVATSASHLYTRRIMGIHVAVSKGAALTIQALSNALLHHPRPGLFHSGNGREY